MQDTVANLIGDFGLEVFEVEEVGGFHKKSRIRCW